MSDAAGTDATTPDYDALELGDFSGVRARLSVLKAQSSPLAQTHAAALGAYLWFAGEREGRLPSEDEVQGWAHDARAHAPLSRVLLALLRARWLALDEAGMVRVGELARALAKDAHGSVQTRAAFIAAAARPVPDPDALAHVFEQAKQQQMAALAIHAQNALVRAHLLRANLGEATRVARRASRMARTEGLPQCQYTANLWLARIRRLNGVPHLAAHILSALSKIAPAPYRPWIRWETLLAGGELSASSAPGTAFGEAALALESMLRNECRKTRIASGRTLEAQCVGLPMIAEEAQDLCIALDGERSLEEASPAMQRWLRGDQPLPPHGLHGAAPQDGPQELGERDVGHVLALVDDARRVLGTPGPTHDMSLIEEARTDRRRVRIESGLAVLALGKGALVDAAFFREVYGFEFNAAIHAQVLDALVSRMRKALGDAGTLTRRAGQLELEMKARTRLADPRCAQPLEDRVLRVLVRAQNGTAKDAADRLGLPLRTIQEALRELSEGGACTKTRRGRSIAYVIEDTTFAPPTYAG